jgi:lipoprotein-anchoring transpeptidase ErfK/SrfK
VAQVPSASRYYHAPLRLWVEETRRDGTWGLVEIPYAWPHERGWIPLDGLKVHRSRITVRVDLSERLVRVYRGEHLLRRFPAAIGAPASPTPPGDYVVTDRVPFSPDSALGSFAFGISGIQPRLPAGWSGGDQLAIHGTNAPWTIGTAASAGCIRVSETALRALLPLLRPGTPISVRP